MTFGENLKALRSSRSISQKELANELGFSFQNISKWERNESLPDINTLITIAKFFDSTVDGLLGYTLNEKVSTLKIGVGEVTIYQVYPEKQEKITDKMVFIIDGNGKITGTFYVAHCRPYRDGYIRDRYDLYDEKSTILFEYLFWDNGVRKHTERTKKVRLPEGGFVIAVPVSDYAAKKIMQFIIPNEYSEWLEQNLYLDYYDGRTGRYLLSDIIKHNELDHITVELSEDGLIFKKPAESVDPLSVNIEVLAQIVRRELEKEHNKQIKALTRKIEELEDLADDNESRISDLDERVNTLENIIAEFELKLGGNSGENDE